jgi:HSP20 family protein
MPDLVRMNGRGGMPALASLDPWRLFDELDRTLPATWTWSSPVWPRFDVEHTDDAIIVSADLPGMTDEDITLTLAGRTLTVEGKTQRKRHSGSFSRQFNLADGLDLQKIEAEIKHGVLTIYVPKSAEAKPRHVKLGTGVLDKVKGLLARNSA